MIKKISKLSCFSVLGVKVQLIGLVLIIVGLIIVAPNIALEPPVNFSIGEGIVYLGLIIMFIIPAMLGKSK